MSSIWDPYWHATTAYAAGAVIRPTTFTGYTWYVTTPGTTGGSEPSWPADPNTTPTVSDGSVTWTVGSGFRQSLSSGILAAVTSFSAANPTIIRSVRQVRPRTFAGDSALPCFFIGDLTEQVVYTQGTRTRTFGGFTAYLVDSIGTRNDSNDRMDFAADVLLDLFTRSVHATTSGRGIVDIAGISDTEFTDEAGTAYIALAFNFAPTAVQEGRT
jgi:hypothetical protein